MPSTPTRTTVPKPASQASSWRLPAGVVVNCSTPSSPPIPSNAAATFTSRWVSTPPVTGRGVSTVVTAIPSLISRFGVAGRPRAAGVIVLLAQDDPPWSVSEPPPQPRLTNLFVKRRPTVGPSSRIRPHPGQIDRTPSPNNRWWIPISQRYILPAGLEALTTDQGSPSCSAR